MWKACRMNCTTSTAPSAHVCTVQHALWSAKVSAKVKASTGTREIEATGLNCATLFLPWHVFQTVFLTKPQHRIYRMRCIQCIPRYFCTRPWLKQNAFGTHFATRKGDVCLTLLISSIFFNLWHTFARWRQMWHSSASFVSFLVHGELQVSGWLLCEMIKLRHKVPPAFCEIWLTCETCESWEQVAGWDRHTDTRFPAKSSTHDQPETQLHRNSTQHQSKMEHGWNMDGT